MTDSPRCICTVLDLSHIPDPGREHPFLRGYDPDCPIHGDEGTRPDRIHPLFRGRRYP